MDKNSDKVTRVQRIFSSRVLHPPPPPPPTKTKLRRIMFNACSEKKFYLENKKKKTLKYVGCQLLYHSPQNRLKSISLNDLNFLQCNDYSQILATLLMIQHRIKRKSSLRRVENISGQTDGLKSVLHLKSDPNKMSFVYKCYTKIDIRKL